MIKNTTSMNYQYNRRPTHQRTKSDNFYISSKQKDFISDISEPSPEGRQREGQKVHSNGSKYSKEFRKQDMRQKPRKSYR